jgi:hypothetical protein
MEQNPYKSPEKASEEKPGDKEPPLPQWRMRLGLACFGIGAIMLIYGAAAIYPPFGLSFGVESFALGAGVVTVGRMLRERPPKWLRR